MSYLVSFAAWIAYAIVGSFASWRAAVFVAAIIEAALTVDLARKRQLDLLSIGTLVFFAAISAIGLAAPHSPIHKWIAAISAGALSVIAGASLLARQPFTLAIAKRTTPKALWSNPEFLRINVFLTRVWTVSFAASAIVCAVAIGVVKSHTGIVVAAQVAGFVIPLRITAVTVTRARARAAAAGIAV